MEIIIHPSQAGRRFEGRNHRHGAEPAKVVVTHDKDKWEGTSSDLSKIPEKIRPEVEKLLHPAFDHNRMSSASDGRCRRRKP